MDPRMVPHPLERAAVRSLVARHGAALNAAASAGLNMHQVDIDNTDEARRFAALLSEVDAKRFWDMYAEELQAWAAHTNAETERIVAASAVDSPKTQIAKLVAFVIVAIVLWMLIVP